MRKLVVVVGLVVCFSSPAFAEPAPAPAPEPAPAPPPAVEQAAPALAPTPPMTYGPPSQAESPAAAVLEEHDGRLDENTALALSLLGTLGGWAMAYATVKAESEGALWLGAAGLVLGPNAGHWYRGAVFTRGTGLRIVGMLATAYGFIRLAFCEGSCDDSDGLYFYGGALLFVGATVDDIVRAPLKVREHNRRLESLSLTPMVTDRGGGLALGGRF